MEQVPLRLIAPVERKGNFGQSLLASLDGMQQTEKAHQHGGLLFLQHPGVSQGSVEPTAAAFRRAKTSE